MYVTRCLQRRWKKAWSFTSKCFCSYFPVFTALTFSIFLLSSHVLLSLSCWTHEIFAWLQISWINLYSVELKLSSCFSDLWIFLYICDVSSMNKYWSWRTETTENQLFCNFHIFQRKIEFKFWIRWMSKIYLDPKHQDFIIQFFLEVNKRIKCSVYSWKLQRQSCINCLWEQISGNWFLEFWNLNLFIFENTLFKRSSREQPMKRPIKHFCTTPSTMGLLFCLLWGPAIINKITANNWEPWFEVMLTAGHRQCQFSVSASRLTLNLYLLISAVQ